MYGYAACGSRDVRFQPPLHSCILMSCFSKVLSQLLTNEYLPSGQTEYLEVSPPHTYTTNRIDAIFAYIKTLVARQHPTARMLSSGNDPIPDFVLLQL